MDFDQVQIGKMYRASYKEKFENLLVIGKRKTSKLILCLVGQNLYSSPGSQITGSDVHWGVDSKYRDNYYWVIEPRDLSRSHKDDGQLRTNCTGCRSH